MFEDVILLLFSGGGQFLGLYIFSIYNKFYEFICRKIWEEEISQYYIYYLNWIEIFELEKSEGKLEQEVRVYFEFCFYIFGRYFFIYIFFDGRRY